MSGSEHFNIPRIVTAGLAGDSGKTLVSVGLVRALRRRGFRVGGFKKGPDFIDAAWLGQAAGRPGRNLDTFLMPKESVLRSLIRNSAEIDLAVIEGNRGLFDGVDSLGSHSTAELAKLLSAPIVLVVDTTKVTRTVAALVMGCLALDSEIALTGVILNRVGTNRQESLIRKALVEEVGVEVLGAIPRLADQHLPSRHLGLVTALEHAEGEEILDRLGEIVEENVDISAIRTLAEQTAPLFSGLPETPPASSAGRVRVGVLRDQAFSFYYPENLEALREEGAELVWISPLFDDFLPQIDVLYAGGGFPEMYAERLSNNRPFLEALARRIRDGLPVWAECGGLMYLSQALLMEGQEFPMVGSLPVAVEHTGRPQGHGYVEAQVDRANPFLTEGCRLSGHEFHYSRLCGSHEDVMTVLDLRRGVGVGKGRDGIRSGSVLAAYTHLHALGVPEWAPALVAAAGGKR